MKNIISWIKENKINFIVLMFLCCIFSFNVAKELTKENDAFAKPTIITEEKVEIEAQKQVIIFSQPLCSSCDKQKAFAEKILKKKYPDVKFVYFDITKQENMNKMKEYFKKYDIPLDKLATPTIFIGNNYLLGYKSDNTTGKKLDEYIQKNYFGEKIEFKNGDEKEQIEDKKYLDTPFGKVNIFEKSLPALAIIMGLVDGFNPCAMWVLVYLISLIASLNDRKKIWLLVGTFVLASGVLYFLFMTALLKVFLYIGYLHVIQVLIGCAAFYVGFCNLKTYFSKNIQCKVGNLEDRQKTMTKAQNLVNSKITIATFLGIIALAFAVNSMEFVCSAALPAIFTGILVQSELSAIAYYSYILLYVFFFMLDDLIIFSLAAFAVNKFIGDKYVLQSKLIGGIVLILLGILLLFFPEYLK